MIINIILELIIILYHYYNEYNDMIWVLGRMIFNLIKRKNELSTLRKKKGSNALYFKEFLNI